MDRERRRWEEEAEEELVADKPAEPVHYQGVRSGEIRNHGVGYFAFSTDTKKREEEMKMLTKLREQVSTALTVEPLIKATPGVRTPLYKGHFAESQVTLISGADPGIEGGGAEVKYVHTRKFPPWPCVLRGMLNWEGES